MPIYHMSSKAISRSAGRTSTAAAAYRSATKIVDERTGEIFDFTRKKGVVHSQLVMPPGCEWQPSRSELWNSVELAEKRKDACLVREHEVALPKEMTDAQRLALVQEYASDLAERHGCAVDFAIHSPPHNADKGQENWHAHVMCTTRMGGPNGLGEKCVREKAGRNRKEDLKFERKRWELICNRHLKEVGINQQIDCRSLADQGIARPPGQHLGPIGAAIERKSRQTRRAEDLKKEEQALRQQRSAEQQAEAIRSADTAARLRRRLTKEPNRFYGGEGRASEFLRLDGLYQDIRNGRTVWKFAKTGISVVIDHGDSLAVTRLSDSRIGAAVEIAKQKGWTSLMLTGSPEFLEKAARAALSAGLRIENPELQGLVKTIQQERQQMGMLQPVGAAFAAKARPKVKRPTEPESESPTALGRRSAEVDYLLAAQSEAAKRLRSLPAYAKVSNEHSRAAEALRQAKQRQTEGVKDSPWLREVFSARATEKLRDAQEAAKTREQDARAELSKLESENALKRLMSAAERKRLAAKIEAAREAASQAAKKIKGIEVACSAMADPKARAAYQKWAIGRIRERNEDVERQEKRLAALEAERQQIERRAGFNAKQARLLKEECAQIVKKVEGLTPRERERFREGRIQALSPDDAHKEQEAAARGILNDALQLHDDAVAGRPPGDLSNRDDATALVARGAVRATGARTLKDPQVGKYLSAQLERGDPLACVNANASRCADKSIATVSSSLKQAGVLLGDIQTIRQERFETKTAEGRYRREKQQKEQARKDLDRQTGKTRFDEFVDKSMSL